MKNPFTLLFLFVFVGGLSAADGLEVEPLPPAESLAAMALAAASAAFDARPSQVSRVASRW